MATTSPTAGVWPVPKGARNPYGVSEVIWVRLHDPVETSLHRFVTHYKATYISELLIPTVRETQIHFHNEHCGCDRYWKHWKAAQDLYIVSQQIGNSIVANSAISSFDLIRVSGSRGITDPPPGMWP